MSTGCKSSHNGFLDVSRSNGGLSISGWIGQLSCLTIFSTSLSVAAFLRRWISSQTLHMPYSLVLPRRILYNSADSHEKRFLSRHSAVVLFQFQFIYFVMRTARMISHSTCFFRNFLIFCIASFRSFEDMWW